MTAFGCIYSAKNLKDKQARFDLLSRELGNGFDFLKTNTLKTEKFLSVKHWLPHSRTRAITRDNKTGSWLAVIGNPVSKKYNSISNENVCESILNDYLSIGPEAITSLHSPFAAVLYDGREESLNVITDRVGLQHIYMSILDDGVFVSTSSMALASTIDVHLNRDMLASFFSVGHLMDGQTYYQEIKKVPAATWVKIKDLTVSYNKYWQPPKQDESIGSLKDAVDEFIAKFKNAVDLRLGVDGLTSIELTGGLDSRLNLAVAKGLSRPYHCWTIGENDDIDAIIAKHLQEMVGFKHYVFSPAEELDKSFCSDLELITLLTDGETNSLNIIASPGCNRRSADLREASISGALGEILRGFYYVSQKGCSEHSAVKLDRIINFQMTSNVGIRPAVFSDIFPADYKVVLKSTISKTFEEYPGRGLHWQLDNFYFAVRSQYFAGRSSSFNNFFYRLQLPYFDNDVVDISFRMPWKFKKNSMLLKSAMYEIDKTLADVKLTTGLPARPLGCKDLDLLAGYYYRYGRKALKKIYGAITGKTGAKVNPGSYNELIVEKLRSKEVQNLLDYSNMASGFLYNPDVFTPFIKENYDNGFRNRYQIGLMLSFEILCRKLGGKFKI